MILDASVLVAILLGEPVGDEFSDQIGDAPYVAIGAPTLFEAGMVLLSRLRRDPRPLLNRFLSQAGVQVIPFTERHYLVALDAFERYGKGRHPARLNFGDCLSYAAARVAGLPLLYTGDDFSKTDLAE